MSQVHFSNMKIFPLGAYEERNAPSINLGYHHISETIRARKLKFYARLAKVKCCIAV